MARSTAAEYPFRPIVAASLLRLYQLVATIRWMAATLDERVQGSEAVFEAKFMLPWSFSAVAAYASTPAKVQRMVDIVGHARNGMRVLAP